MLRSSLATIIASAAFAAITVLGAAAARADIALVENNKTVDVDCAKDGRVSLLGNNLVVRVKGVCAELSISGNNATVNGSASTVSVMGNNNTINLDAADDVSITGNDNAVSVRKPIKAKAPRISNPGSRNKITRPS